VTAHFREGFAPSSQQHVLNDRRICPVAEPNVTHAPRLGGDERLLWRPARQVRGSCRDAGRVLPLGTVAGAARPPGRQIFALVGTSDPTSPALHL